MTKSIDIDAAREALLDLGVKCELGETLKDIVSGVCAHVGIETTPLARCYRRVTFLTLNAANETDVPKGNGGNFAILGRGEHPVLGAWIKSSCEYDSSD